MNYDAKLAELYIDLPEPRTLTAATVHAVRSGKLLYLGGCLPLADGRVVARGRVGVEVRLDTARQAARAAAVTALAVLAAESGGTLNRVARIVRVDGCIASGADFHDHEKVIDGASELFLTIFGPAGRHARTVVGCTSLPGEACVSLALIVEMK